LQNDWDVFLFVETFPTLLCCYSRRGPGGKFVPPVLNRNANDDDG